MRLILVLMSIFLLASSVNAASPEENIDRASVILVGKVESSGIESTVRIMHVLKGRVNEQDIVLEYSLPEGEVFLLLDDDLELLSSNSVGLVRDGEVYRIENFRGDGYIEAEYLEEYNGFWQARLKELQSMPAYIYIGLGLATAYAVKKYVDEREKK